MFLLNPRTPSTQQTNKPHDEGEESNRTTAQMEKTQKLSHLHALRLCPTQSHSHTHDHELSCYSFPHVMMHKQVQLCREKVCSSGGKTYPFRKQRQKQHSEKDFLSDQRSFEASSSRSAVFCSISSLLCLCRLAVIFYKLFAFFSHLTLKAQNFCVLSGKRYSTPVRGYLQESVAGCSSSLCTSLTFPARVKERIFGRNGSERRQRHQPRTSVACIAQRRTHRAAACSCLPLHRHLPFSSSPPR